MVRRIELPDDVCVKRQSPPSISNGRRGEMRHTMRSTARAQVATASDRRMDVITFIALSTTLIVAIGQLLRFGLW
jgi:hypothetical protein